MGTSLCGRDAELARLREVLGEASAGGGSVILLVGEAGIGKSRLAGQCAAMAREAGLRVLVGRTTEDDAAPPHWPWLQVLAPLGRGDLLLAPAGADPQAERFARQVAVTSAVFDAPSIVLVEDVHRADIASLRLLVHVAHEVSRRPALLVVTFRPDPADHAPGFGSALDEIMRAERVERLDLRGLDLPSVTHLLGPATSAEVAQRVVEVSDGNPLLVGELARHLASGGSIDTVPGSVRDSVKRRLTARTAQCVDAVRWGALVGREFAGALVAHASARPAVLVLTALDEAVDAGLLEPGSQPGRYRFLHALIRDAVAGTMGVPDRAVRHRALAEAVEALDGAGDESVGEIARHWDVASVLGDHPIAAAWCERAARVADRRLAWDEAGRLFDRALALGGQVDPVAVFDRAVGSARARLHCDELDTTVNRCLVAARAALAAGRPDLLAEAILVPEARGVTSRELYDLGEIALAGLEPSAHALRARVHGQLVNLGFYLDQESTASHVDAAEAEAAVADDPLAELAAIRARQMVSYAAEHAELRLVLAEQFGRVARAARLPTAALWEPLWRIDTLVELGRLPEAVALLPSLRNAVSAAGTPIARWHLARTESHLAQASGRFSDAVHHAEAARELYLRLEEPFAGEYIYLSQMSGIGLHAGDAPGVADRLAHAPIHLAPPRLGDMPALGSAEACLRLGDRDGALDFYRRVGPARAWFVPDHLGLYPWALRLRVAAALALTDELPPLLDALEPHRGQHVANSGGMVSYLGPIDLWTGIARAALGRWNDADHDLAAASHTAEVAGTPAFRVHADVERAQVLTARAGPGDSAHAVRILTAARSVTVRLGMPDFLARIDSMLEAPGAGDIGPLSPREAEVAALVAQGLTNRAIARTLIISERTAQNHVQHILTKLSLATRREVAAWYREGWPPKGLQR
jgi:DNA-binding CsgD family transcriptional regulator